jgi:hypothetical protein
MRFLLLLVAMIIPAFVQAGQKKSVRDDVGIKLKEEFRFEPARQVEAMGIPKNEILVLEKITVTGLIKWDLFDQTMNQQHKARLKEETFTLRDGGPFVTKDLGKVRAQIGLWGEGGGLAFLKFRW